MTKKKTTRYVIKGMSGTYLRSFTGIGPCFGATKKTAARFDAVHEAYGAMSRHSIAFVGAKIVPVEETCR